MAAKKEKPFRICVMKGKKSRCRTLTTKEFGRLKKFLTKWAEGKGIKVTRF